MGVQGRPKGCKAEIEVAKILEPWWSKHEPLAPDGHPIRFVRTPLSGGWGGKDTRSGFKASGDLMTTARRFPFTVEVKRREGWSWKNLLAGKNSPVWGWWRQAIDQGVEMNQAPLLWLRHNRESWSVMVPFAVLSRHVTRKCAVKDGMLCGDGAVRWHEDAIVSEGGSPLDRMKTVMRVWAPSELAKVDYALVLPALVSAKNFLSVHPEAWEMACRDVLGK